MSVKLSYFFADFFIARNWIKKEDKLVYVVGLDVIFSTLEQSLIVILIGLWRGRLIEAIIYLAFFSSIRKYSGGYHASTRTGCMAVFTAAYLAADVFAVSICESKNLFWFIVYGICSLLLANVIFCLYVPIKNERKRYLEYRVPYMRKKAFIYMNLWNAPAFVMVFFYPAIAVQIFSVTNVVVFLILLCKPWRKKA